MEEIRDGLATVDIRIVGLDRSGIVPSRVQVLIDGRCVGELTSKREESFQVAAGVRQARVKFLRLRSEVMDLSLSDGERSALECGFHQLPLVRLNLIVMISVAIIMFMQYLRLPFMVLTISSFILASMGVLGWETFITAGNSLYLRPRSVPRLPGSRPSGALRLPRMTIRKGMIAVALIAVLLAIGILEMTLLRRAANDRQRDQYRDLAGMYAEFEELWRTIDARLADYYAGMKEKYLRAASRPWESVEADPPRPP